jgi:predicted small lipoprotein YifL
MKIKALFLCSVLVGLLALAGCGKQNPLQPSSSAQKGNHTVKAQELKPTDIAYTGIFGGDPGLKPWYWFDANDTPDFDATIRTTSNGASANITRVTGGTWGKVHTAAISCAAKYHYLRIFVPSHSGSVTWKIVIQEEGGQWRSWTLQDSTGDTGYKDYDFTAILASVNTGSGKFTINLVVEGAVGEYVEVAELYVFAQVNIADANNAYWEQTFPMIDDVPGMSGHTPGWFDQTTNPDFGATLMNDGNYEAAMTVTGAWGWGKVLSPVITCDLSVFKTLRIWMLNWDSDPRSDSFRIGIQEQGGAYRHWWVSPPTQFPNPSFGFSAYAWDVSGLGISSNVPISIEITILGKPAKLFFQSIGLYKQ